MEAIGRPVHLSHNRNETNSDPIIALHQLNPQQLAALVASYCPRSRAPEFIRQFGITGASFVRFSSQQLETLSQGDSGTMAGLDSILTNSTFDDKKKTFPRTMWKPPGIFQIFEGTEYDEAWQAIWPNLYIDTFTIDHRGTDMDSTFYPRWKWDFPSHLNTPSPLPCDDHFPVSPVEMECPSPVSSQDTLSTPQPTSTTLPAEDGARATEEPDVTEEFPPSPESPCSPEPPCSPERHSSPEPQVEHEVEEPLVDDDAPDPIIPGAYKRTPSPSVFHDFHVDEEPQQDNPTNNVPPQSNGVPLTESSTAERKEGVEEVDETQAPTSPLTTDSVSSSTVYYDVNAPDDDQRRDATPRPEAEEPEESAARASAADVSQSSSTGAPDPLTPLAEDAPKGLNESQPDGDQLSSSSSSSDPALIPLPEDAPEDWNEPKLDHEQVTDDREDASPSQLGPDEANDPLIDFAGSPPPLPPPLVIDDLDDSSFANLASLLDSPIPELSGDWFKPAQPVILSPQVDVHPFAPPSPRSSPDEARPAAETNASKDVEAHDETRTKSSTNPPSPDQLRQKDEAPPLQNDGDVEHPAPAVLDSSGEQKRHVEPASTQKDDEHPHPSKSPTSPPEVAEETQQVKPSTRDGVAVSTESGPPNHSEPSSMDSQSREKEDSISGPRNTETLPHNRPSTTTATPAGHIPNPLQTPEATSCQHPPDVPPPRATLATPKEKPAADHPPLPSTDAPKVTAPTTSEPENREGCEQVVKPSETNQPTESGPVLEPPAEDTSSKPTLPSDSADSAPPPAPFDPPASELASTSPKGMPDKTRTDERSDSGKSETSGGRVPASVTSRKVPGPDGVHCSVWEKDMKEVTDGSEVAEERNDGVHTESPEHVTPSDVPAQELPASAVKETKEISEGSSSIPLGETPSPGDSKTREPSTKPPCNQDAGDDSLKEDKQIDNSAEGLPRIQEAHGTGEGSTVVASELSAEPPCNQDRGDVSLTQGGQTDESARESSASTIQGADKANDRSTDHEPVPESPSQDTSVPELTTSDSSGSVPPQVPASEPTPTSPKDEPDKTQSEERPEEGKNEMSGDGVTTSVISGKVPGPDGVPGDVWKLDWKEGTDGSKRTAEESINEVHLATPEQGISSDVSTREPPASPVKTKEVQGVDESSTAGKHTPADPKTDGSGGETPSLHTPEDSPPEVEAVTPKGSVSAGETTNTLSRDITDASLGVSKDKHKTTPIENVTTTTASRPSSPLPQPSERGSTWDHIVREDQAGEDAGGARSPSQEASGAANADTSVTSSFPEETQHLIKGQEEKLKRNNGIPETSGAETSSSAEHCDQAPSNSRKGEKEKEKKQGSSTPDPTQSEVARASTANPGVQAPVSPILEEPKEESRTSPGAQHSGVSSTSANPPDPSAVLGEQVEGEDLTKVATRTGAAPYLPGDVLQESGAPITANGTETAQKPQPPSLLTRSTSVPPKPTSPFTLEVISPRRPPSSLTEDLSPVLGRILLTALNHRTNVLDKTKVEEAVEHKETDEEICDGSGGKSTETASSIQKGKEREVDRSVTDSLEADDTLKAVSTTLTRAAPAPVHILDPNEGTSGTTDAPLSQHSGEGTADGAVPIDSSPENAGADSVPQITVTSRSPQGIQPRDSAEFVADHDIRDPSPPESPHSPTQSGPMPEPAITERPILPRLRTDVAPDEHNTAPDPPSPRLPSQPLPTSQADDRLRLLGLIVLIVAMCTLQNPHPAPRLPYVESGEAVEPSNPPHSVTGQHEPSVPTEPTPTPTPGRLHLDVPLPLARDNAPDTAVTRVSYDNFSVVFSAFPHSRSQQTTALTTPETARCQPPPRLPRHLSGNAHPPPMEGMRRTVSDSQSDRSLSPPSAELLRKLERENERLKADLRTLQGQVFFISSQLSTLLTRMPGGSRYPF